MADDNQDAADKSEEPTEKRLRDAAKKGNVINSREVTSFFMLAFFMAVVILMAPVIMRNTVDFLAPFIQRPHDINVEFGNMHRLFGETFKGTAMLMMMPIGGSVIIAIIASILQHGINASTESMKPKAERISPLAGLKRMFSMKSIVEFLKGIFKITLVAVAAYYVVEPELSRLEQIPQYSLDSTMSFLAALAFKIILAAVLIMAAIAFIDYVYQRFEYMKSLRMSKQEIKEEYKQTEGDPIIKGKLKQIRAERAKKRMMAAVPNADVIITNPTHFAVALKYDEATMAAPIALAIGQDHLALTMRKIAKENEIPIVENPPLARSLYASCEIDQEIPLEHYQAVAEIISYVYKLKGKMS